MKKYWDTVLDTAGNAVPNASIVVTAYPGDTAVNIYTANSTAGTPVAASTVTTDSTGFFFFYAPDGQYILKVYLSGTLYRTLTDVQIIDDTYQEVPPATVAALKAIVPSTLTNGKRVSILGYYTAGDGGEGDYYWDSSSSATDNGGSVIQPTAGGTGRWLALGMTKFMQAERFGLKGDDSADNSAAWSNLLIASDAAKVGIEGLPGKIYQMGTFTIASTGYVPAYINMNGSTIKAKAGSSGVLCLVENPHGKRRHFRFENVCFDANSLCTNGFKLHGSQGGNYNNIYGIKATGVGVWISGESGYGVYYNRFTDMQSGEFGSGNTSRGIDVKSIGAGNFIASNTWINTRSQYNGSHGWDLDWASNTFVGCESEQNAGAAFNADNTYDTTWLGGYTESNDTGSGDKRTFVLTANSTGFKIIGGRHIGAGAYSATNGITGTTTGLGNVFMPTNMATGPTINELGKATLETVVSRGGVGVNSAGANSDAVNFSNATTPSIQMSGTTITAIDKDNTLWRFVRSIVKDRTGKSSSAGALDLSAVTTPEVSVALTENITSITFPTAVGERELGILFVQGGGSYTIAGWPGTAKLAGGAFTMTATNGKADWLLFRYSGATSTWIERDRSQNM